MNEAPSIQWFPGHMAKTKRMITANLKYVDAVVEITDARIPISSRNPDLNKLIAGKPKIVMLNKCDEADSTSTEKWLSYYKSIDIAALATDCRSGKGIKSFVPLIKEVLSDLLERRRSKGMIGAPLHLMIVGIPNVGKSSFINRMAKSKKTKVEDRPGVTREKQWVKIDDEIELLDMPGVLWPKFEDKSVGEKLAFTGAIKDDILDIELLASRLIEHLVKLSYDKKIIERYGIDISENEDGYTLLEKIGRKRGMLISGGEVNTERAAIAVLDEYRSGKLGRITLEVPSI